MADVSNALVLAGGGVAGIAWELGIIDGLRRNGVDVTTADLIVGTSAGSTVGAQVATGQLDAAIEAQREDQTAEIQVDFDLEKLRARLADLVVGATSAAEARGRIGRMALDADTVPEAVRRAVIEARLPAPDWPARRLVVVAVDALEGTMVAFDRQSGVPLVDAVAASCAVPGVWPPATIGSRRYVDGGVRSFTNADLAVGCDRVLVLIPIELIGPAQEQFDRERQDLGATPTLVVRADRASLDAIGANPLDPQRRRPALEAAIAQAAAEAPRVKAFWTGSSSAQGS
jgi:NTE family protein